MTSPPLPPADREQLAAEWALGVLEGDELAAARALLSSDPAFGEEVERWSGRLAPMLEEVEPLDPPAETWNAVEARIRSSAAEPSNVIPLRRRTGLWQGVAAATSALAASLAIVLVSRPPAPAPQPGSAPIEVAARPMVAMLADESKAMKMVATWTPGSRQLVVVAAGELPAAPRQSHELWVIPADGKPRSLGVMPDDARMHLDLAGAMSAQMHGGAVLAVTLEPAGGSPSGAPTGPILVSGALEQA